MPHVEHREDHDPGGPEPLIGALSSSCIGSRASAIELALVLRQPRPDPDGDEVTSMISTIAAGDLSPDRIHGAPAAPVAAAAGSARSCPGPAGRRRARRARSAGDSGAARRQCLRRCTDRRAMRSARMRASHFRRSTSPAPATDSWACWIRARAARGALQVHALPLVGILAADARQVRPGALGAPLERPVVDRIRRRPSSRRSAAFRSAACGSSASGRGSSPRARTRPCPARRSGS